MPEQRVIDRLTKYMKEKHLNANMVTVSAGLSVGQIGKALKEGTALNSKTIEKILHAYPDLNPDWFMTGHGSMLVKKPSDESSGLTLSKEEEPDAYISGKYVRPVVVTVDSLGRNTIVQVDTKAAAGLPANYDNPEFFKHLPTFHLPDPQFKNGTFMRIQITGDSMHPTIKHKDWVFAEFITDFRDIREGYIHLIITREGVVAKRILNRVEKRKKIVLQSDNTSYSTYEEEITDVLQIWKVHAKLSFDLSNENADVRKDINWLKAEVTDIRSKLK